MTDGFTEWASGQTTKESNILVDYADGLRILREEKKWSYGEIAKALQDKGVEVTQGAVRKFYVSYFKPKIKARKRRRAVRLSEIEKEETSAR